MPEGPYDKSKVFCIGRCKTGTTSLGAALSMLGFKLGDQPSAERLIESWARRDFASIVDHCRSADAFQDVPFSLPFTYAALDFAFPGSKFILSVRDNGDQWFDSLVRFHSNLMCPGRMPTAEDLKRFDYQSAGWMWRTHVLIFGCNERTVYDRQSYIRQYEAHCTQVNDYFKHRADDLLVLNLNTPRALSELCEFLGVDDRGLTMPHMNSSRDPATLPPVHRMTG